jgi:homocysteine S-methyltransferase
MKLLDGSMGTELERRGFQISKMKLWSASMLDFEPDVIKSIHRDYIAAGVDYLTTNSYQASIEGFVECGYSKEDAIKFINRSVEIAAEAVAASGRDVKVLFSCGPYGAYLAEGQEYTGDYGDATESDLMEFHRGRLNALSTSSLSRLHAILFETMPSLREIEAISKLLQEYSFDVWISLSMKDENAIADGSSVFEVARVLRMVTKLKVVGVNCASPKIILQCSRSLRNAFPESKLMICPNSGEEWDHGKRCWKANTAASLEEFAALAKQAKQEFIDIMGGCCRTTPAHIQKIQS